MIPMLPKLKVGRDRQLRAITRPGWAPGELSDLRDLAESLQTGGTAPGGITIDAVPDIWARLLVFAFSLLEPDHPLHAQSVAAFRGFLALLALRHQRGINVQVARKNLREPGGAMFLEAVTRLRPESAMSSDTVWDEAFVFTLRNQAIGMTSPLTLVCPNEGIHLNSLAHVSWFNGVRFEDPAGKLGVAELQSVAVWISGVETAISEHDREGVRFTGAWRDLLLRLLHDFRRDLTAGDPEFHPDAATVEMSPDRLPLNYGLYYCLSDALAEAPVDLRGSMVLLRSMRPRLPDAPALPSLLLFDRDLHTKWRVDPSKITICSNCTQNDIRDLPLGNDRSRIGTRLLPSHAQWRRPEDFFVDTLILIKESPRAFPGAIAIRGQAEIAAKYSGTPVAPLAPEILAYLPPEYIRQNAFFREGNEGVEFCLVLPLEDNRKVEISRLYQSDSIKDHRAPLPVFEIWPDFSDRRWKAYFSFWDSRGEDSIHLRPFVPGAESEASTERSGSKSVQREITSITAPPEYLLCSVPAEEAEGKGAWSPAGVLIPEMPTLPTDLEPAEFHIGIDFGTTNTNIYMRRGANEPQPLQLRTVTHQVTAATAAVRDSSLFRFFLPPASVTATNSQQYEEAPFLSFFRTREESPETAITPVLQGHILFYHRRYNDSDLGIGRVRTNLKWRDEDQAKLKAYLKQLCLQAAAEAFRQGGKSIRWYYSLPTAFPMWKVDDLRSVWESIRDWTQRYTGVKCPEGNLVCQTESVVAARYFAAKEGREKALPAVGSVFIDIGGGTSDISVWQKNLLLQTSVRLSGAEIFLEPLFQMRKDVLRVLRLPGIDDQRRSELQNIRERHVFYAKVDALLRSEGDAVRAWLEEAPREDASLKRFTDYIGLGLAGLFYFTGLTLRHLREEGRYGQRLPSVHVGGNGSRLFHWVARGNHGPNALINALFREMLLKSSGLDPAQAQLRIFVSDRPKAEAAYGLVVDFPLEDADHLDRGAFHFSISGEAFEHDGRAFPNTARLTREMLSRGVAVSELNSLRDFIEVYNRFAERPDWNLQPIESVDEMLASVNDSVSQWADQERSRPLRDVELEPLFIVGMREFLRAFLETEPSARRVAV